MNLQMDRSVWSSTTICSDEQLEAWMCWCRSPMGQKRRYGVEPVTKDRSGNRRRYLSQHRRILKYILHIHVYSPKKFCNIYTIFFVFKTVRVCNFAKCEKNVWNNTTTLYGYVNTNTQISEFIRKLFWKFLKFTFSQNFAKCWDILLCSLIKLF